MELFIFVQIKEAFDFVMSSPAHIKMAFVIYGTLWSLSCWEINRRIRLIERIK